MSNKGFKIVRMTREHLDGAVVVLRKSFFPDERICNCVRILTDSEVVEQTPEYKVTKSAKELEALCIDCSKDGVSVVALDTNTGEVLGVAFNKIQVKAPPGELSYFENFAKENVRDGPAQALVDFMVKVDSKFDLFETLNINCLLEVMFLGVLFTSKGRGIGQALVEASIDLAQKIKDKNLNKDASIDVASEAKEYGRSPTFNLTPMCVSAIFSSRFSQRVGERCKMKVMMEIPYTEFEYRGKKFSEVTGTEHPTCTLSCRVLN